MSFADLVIEDRRYLILKALQSSAGYKASTGLLQAFLDSFGQKVSADLLVADLAWLNEMNLVSLDKLIDCSIVTLKPRGADVAAGRSQHPGIRRPQAGEM